MHFLQYFLQFLHHFVQHFILSATRAMLEGSKQGPGRCTRQEQQGPKQGPGRSTREVPRDQRKDPGSPHVKCQRGLAKTPGTGDALQPLGAVLQPLSATRTMPYSAFPAAFQAARASLGTKVAEHRESCSYNIQHGVPGSEVHTSSARGTKARTREVHT